MEFVPSSSSRHRRRDSSVSRWSEKSSEKWQAKDLDNDHGYRSSEEKARPVLASGGTTTTRSNYKPVALRWPFLVTHVLLLILAMTAVIFLQTTRPDSDHSAIVDGRPLAKLAVIAGGDDVGRSAVKRSVVGAESDSTTPEPVTATAVSHAATTAAGADNHDGGEPGFTSLTSLVLPEPATPSSTARSATDVGVTSLVPTDIQTSTARIKPGFTTFTLSAPPAKPPTKTKKIPSPERTTSDVGIVSPVPIDTQQPSEVNPGFTTFKLLAPPAKKPTKTKKIPSPERTTSDAGGSILGFTDGETSNRGFGFKPSDLPTGGRLSQRPLNTATDDPFTIPGTPWTSQVARIPEDHPNPGPAPTEVDEPPVTTAVRPGKPQGPKALAPLAPSRQVKVLVDAITTTLVVPGEPQTLTDAAGQPSVLVPASHTIVALWGGTIRTSTAVDDGLVAETSTIVTSIAGSAVTLLAITTPGKPITETAVSVMGGTAVTVAPPPVTVVVDMGNGALVTSVSTPPAFVTTTGGTTTTLTRITTPGRIVTTDIATTVNGTPTTLLAAVLTITPTPSTPVVPYYLDATAAPTRHPGDSSGVASSSTDDSPDGIPGGSADGSAGGSAGGSADGSTKKRFLPGFTSSEYFAGAFLPTLIAAALAVSMTVIDSAAKQYAPFSALARPGGAAGPEAMTLRFGGVGGALAAPAALARRGLPVPFVTGALASLSRGLAPLAAEAVGFKLHGTCTHLSVAGCGIALGVAPGPAYALAAMLAVMAALVAVAGVMVTRWETGLHDQPWSVAAIAALSLDGGLRQRLLATGEPDEAELDALFADGRFGMAHFATSVDGDERDTSKEDGLGEASAGNSSSLYGGEGSSEPIRGYGIVPLRDPVSEKPDGVGSHGWQSSEGLLSRFGPRHVPFLALTLGARAVFMALLLGLMALIIYYHLLREDNAFELFMDSQTFGVRLLFAALGSIITAFWTAFFMSELRPFPFSPPAHEVGRNSQPR